MVVQVYLQSLMGMLCLLVPIVAVSRVHMCVSVRVCMTVGMGVNNVAM